MVIPRERGNGMDNTAPIVLVTGSTDGIGKQTALELARTGAHVIVHGRNHERVMSSVEDIRRRSGNQNVDGITADLASLASVRTMARELLERTPRLNVVVHNAGVYMNERVLTPDGYEMTFAVNHLAPFYLTYLLGDLLVKSAPSRVVTVSSVAHVRGRLDFHNLQGQKHFDPYGAYALSKLANVLFSNELALRLQGTGATSNSLHPGVITTKLLHAGFNMAGASVEEGAQTPVYLASSPEVSGVTGKYFVRKQPVAPAPVTLDSSVRKEFWEASEHLLGIPSSLF